MNKLSIIVPCYFNEKNIPITGEALIQNESSFPKDLQFEYIFVDDGSKDKTLEELFKFQNKYHDKVKIIKLTRNFGANSASHAGIKNSTGDCCVILTADMQDPPEIIIEMYECWEEGEKFVLANRIERNDGFFNSLTSKFIHLFIRRFILKNAPFGGFDLWLFDKQLRDDIINMKITNTFLPYLFIWLGYEFKSIPFVRKKREVGKSKWTLKKKIKSLIDIFVSFSFGPIRIISFLGIVTGLIAFSWGIWILISHFFYGVDVEGWTSIIVIVLFLGSANLISIGVIGEYIWRALDSSSLRPDFIIEEIYPIKMKK